MMAQLGYFPVQELNNEFALTAITVDYDDRPVASGESAYKRYSSSASPRTRVPWRHQNHPEALHQSIIKSWQAAEPDEKRKGEIERIMQKLTHTINNSTSYIDNPGRNRYKVDAFGSMAWGGDTGKSGDLDLVVLDTYLPRGYEPITWRVPPEQMRNGHTTSAPATRNPKVPQLYDVRWLSQFMQNSAGMLDTKFIAATTPIVKFKARDSNLECDINVNDLGGWYNSRLILAYCEISPYVLRPLIHALKKWLAHHQLNDPSGESGQRSMSSYCLTLMAIAYLQHIGHLPNLQKNVESSLLPASEADQDDVIWVGWGKEQGQIAHIKFDAQPPSTWVSSTPALTVGDALRGFFFFFCSGGGAGRYNYPSQFVSIANGGIVQRRHRFRAEMISRQQYRKKLEGNPNGVIATEMKRYDERVNRDDLCGKCDQIQPRQWGNFKFIVQDPFLWQKNCAGSMDRPAVERFIRAITRTSQYLSEKDKVTLGDLLRMEVETR